MELKIFRFTDKEPRRGKIVCFNEDDAQADFYFLDGKGLAWGKVSECSEWEFACPIPEVQKYGGYSHWARTDKFFNIDFDIPTER
jgi:hypothetical protein